MCWSATASGTWYISLLAALWSCGVVAAIAYYLRAASGRPFRYSALAVVMVYFGALGMKMADKVLAPSGNSTGLGATGIMLAVVGAVILGIALVAVTQGGAIRRKAPLEDKDTKS
jgi:ABC-type transport system involved in cytochrome c biogenesis permease subunit